MSLIHQLTNFLIVAIRQSIADSQHTVFLSQYETGTFVIILTNISLHFLQLFPCTVTQRLEAGFRMLGGNLLNDILARIATVIIGRAGQFMLNGRVKKDQTIAVGLEGEILEFAVTTV